jgi:hypothetical protein
MQSNVIVKTDPGLVTGHVTKKPCFDRMTKRPCRGVLERYQDKGCFWVLGQSTPVSMYYGTCITPAGISKDILSASFYDARLVSLKNTARLCSAPAELRYTQPPDSLLILEFTIPLVHMDRIADSSAQGTMALRNLSKPFLGQPVAFAGEDHQ